MNILKHLPLYDDLVEIVDLASSRRGSWTIAPSPAHARLQALPVLPLYEATVTAIMEVLVAVMTDSDARRLV